MVQTLWKTAWRIFKKLKIELAYDPAIIFMGIYAKATKTLTQKDTHTSLFIATLFTRVRRKTTCVHRWMNEQKLVAHTHIHSGILLGGR